MIVLFVDCHRNQQPVSEAQTLDCIELGSGIVGRGRILIARSLGIPRDHLGQLSTVLRCPREINPARQFSCESASAHDPA